MKLSCSQSFGLLLTAAIVCVGPSSVQADHSPAVFGGGSGGPINTIPGTLLERGHAVVSYRYDYLGIKNISDRQLLDFESAGYDSHSSDRTTMQFATLAYGATDRLTLAVRQPYLTQNNIREPDGSGGVDALGSSGGFGDTQFFAFRRLIHNERRGVYLSGLVGFDVPTGRTNNYTGLGNLFETEHQPGSGSLDPIIGLNATKNYDRFSWHTSVSRLFNTRGSHFTTLGDVFNYNTAFVYRLTSDSQPRPEYFRTASPSGLLGADILPTAYHDEDRHDHHGHSEHADSRAAGHDHREHRHGPLIDLICEFNGVNQGKHVVDGVLDQSSGGQVLYISPGIRVTLREDWSTFFQGGVPIYQHVNGANHQIDYRLTIGTAYFF